MRLYGVFSGVESCTVTETERERESKGVKSETEASPHSFRLHTYSWFL